MNYNLISFKYFIDVVQTHGFGSAAKRNFVSETAVSSAIAKLEKSLGQKLLLRSNGQFELTPIGEEFYHRAVEIIDSYDEIWHHLDFQPTNLVKIHFLQGLENEASKVAQSYVAKGMQVSLDEEAYSQAISRLLKGYYHLLIGFELAFENNNKLETKVLRNIDFDLLYNVDEAQHFNELKEMTSNAVIYLQYWKSVGLQDVQEKMLTAYCQNGWKYQEVEGVNSFEAACLNVQYRGGIALVPETFNIPYGCDKVHRITPEHLKNKFRIVAVKSIENREILF